MTDEKIFEKKIKLKLGKQIAGGNGFVYELKEYPTRFIKIVDWDYVSHALHDLSKVIQLLNYLSKTKNTSVAKVYNVGTFAHNNNTYFYYVMQKLRKTEDAWEAMDALYNKRVGSTPKIKKFIKEVKRLKYSYKDCHGGNCMQDAKGNLKLIDLESFLWS